MVWTEGQGIGCDVAAPTPLRRRQSPQHVRKVHNASVRLLAGKLHSVTFSTIRCFATEHFLATVPSSTNWFAIYFDSFSSYVLLYLLQINMAAALENCAQCMRATGIPQYSFTRFTSDESLNIRASSCVVSNVGS